MVNCLQKRGMDFSEWIEQVRGGFAIRGLDISGGWEGFGRKCPSGFA
jgi:hypothetical protein